MSLVEEFDIVLLTVDKPEWNLKAGMSGTVVEPLMGDHALVEFSDSMGATIETVSIRCEEISVIVPYRADNFSSDGRKGKLGFPFEKFFPNEEKLREATLGDYINLHACKEAA